MARGDQRSGLLPRARDRRSWRTSTDYLWPGFGPFESYEADHTVGGGETLELAGLAIDVDLHPGPQPRARHLRDRRARTRCSPVTSCSRDRSGGSTCRAATGRRCWPRSRSSRARTRPRPPCTPATWGSPRSGASAPPTRSCASSRSGERSVIQAPRGTFDILPESAAQRKVVEEQAEKILGAAGYGRIETPTFEATELFARGVGEATDIVQKEMYTFDDGGGRSLTLRPEGTAPVCRAYLEHGMHKLAQPVKLWYLSSFFRSEAPQRGRYRQFWQIGAEAIGSADARDRRRADRAAGRPARRAWRQARPTASLEPGHARDPGRVSRGAAGLPARPRGSARPRTSATGSTSTRCERSTPTTGVHAQVMRRRAEAARPSRRPTTPSTSLRCGRCSTTPGSPTSSTRHWCAASTTTRARCSSSPATSSAPSRASAAAADTTG